MNSHIRKLAIVGSMAAILLSAGCQNNHRESLKQAESRWSHARASVLMQLAEQQFQSGQSDKALVSLGKALELDPNYPRLQVLRGQILAEKGQGSAAVSAFELAVAMDPASAEAHYQLAVQLERGNQLETALEHYQIAHRMAPTQVAYAGAVAEVLGQLNRTNEALELIESMLTVQEQSVALRVTGGGLAMARGDYELACNYYRDAARLATDDNDVIRSLAMACYRAGHYDQAQGYLEQLLEPTAGQPVDAAAPGRSELLTALGDCYLVANLPHKARPCFEQVAKLFPNQAGAWENLAKVALHEGRWGDALLAADRAVALSPGRASGHVMRGFALNNQGSLSESVKALLTAHSLAPRDVLPLCLLSDSYRQMGDAKSARDALVRALQIEPTDPLAGRMMNELARVDFPAPTDSQATAAVAVPQ